MADNTTLNLGSGGDVIASDDIAGVKHQRVKISLGADGSATDALGGAGAVAAGVQRVTLASDDPAVALLTTMDADTGNLAGILTAVQTIDNIVSGSSAQVVGAAAENAAASGNPVQVGGRYDSSARTLGNGDVGAIALNASGQVLVEIAAGAGSGGTSAADDADFTAGTTSGTPVMGAYQSSPTAVTDGDMAIVGITANREMKVSVTSGGVSGKVDDAAFTAGTDEGVLLMGVASSDSVDSGDAGAIAMTTARAMHTAVQSIAAGDNNIGNVDVVTLPGSAHDAAVSGNPIRIAGRAATSDYTAVAAGDTADLLATLTGKQVVYPYSLPGASWSYASAAAVTDTADDEAKAAGGAGVRHYITGVQVFNGHDTVGTEVVIKDGATVLWRGWAEQAGGGCSAKFDPPLRGTAATAVNVANITTGSSTYFNLQGFSAAE